MFSSNNKCFNLIGAEVYIDDKFQEAELYIEKGKVFIGREKKAINIYLEKNLKIRPGLIDPHVHMRDFTQSHKEDWRTGSIAAICGGITTVIDMPNNNPQILSRELMWKKISKIFHNSIVNGGIHFGSSDTDIKEIKQLHTAQSVKVYMNDTTGDLKITDKTILEEIFNSYHLITVHAEDEKVEEAIDLIKKTNNKLYLCHVSTKDEIEYITKNKIKGKIFVEVTPHHLFLNESHENNFIKMKPGLKNNKDVEALWKGIENGVVDTIGSDHAPHTIDEKESSNPPFGVPGLETMLPLLFTAYNQGRISLKKIIELTSENPAKIFGFQNKGFIQNGFDADLAICDLKKEREVHRKNLKTKCGWSPFEGWSLKGWPIKTIVGGKIINIS